MLCEPILSWQTEPNTFYTVMCIDPDAMSRLEPNLRNVLHWLVVNVPNNDLTKGDLKVYEFHISYSMIK